MFVDESKIDSDNNNNKDDKILRLFREKENNNEFNKSLKLNKFRFYSIYYNTTKPDFCEDDDKKEIGDYKKVKVIKSKGSEKALKRINEPNK